MRWKIAVFSLLAVGLLVLLVHSWESEASPPKPACSTCQTACNNYCTKQGSHCQFASPICWDGDCGPGACSFICANDQTGSFNCDCTYCPPPPGGSPIFRKEETCSAARDAEPTSGGF